MLTQVAMILFSVAVVLPLLVALAGRAVYTGLQVQSRILSSDLRLP